MCGERRGQVRGPADAGAAVAGATAQYLAPATTMTVLAVVSVVITVASRPFVARVGVGARKEDAA